MHNKCAHINTPFSRCIARGPGSACAISKQGSCSSHGETNPLPRVLQTEIDRFLVTATKGAFIHGKRGPEEGATCVISRKPMVLATSEKIAWSVLQYLHTFQQDQRMPHNRLGCLSSGPLLREASPTRT